MYYKREVESLAHMLENMVFLCVGAPPPEIERRQKDRGDVKIVNLPTFVGQTQNDSDVDLFLDRTNIDRIEDETRTSKKVCVVVAPNFTTLKVAYALMRGWCAANAVDDLKEINKSFDATGLLPLIPQSKKPRE